MKDNTMYAPPGMETKKEKNGFILLMLYYAAIFVGFLGELVSALERLGRLFGGYDRMPDFYQFLDGFLILPVVVILYCVVTMLLRFWYYHQGSKSIYLMRRLPDRSVLIRSCVEILFKRILLSLAVMVGMLLLFYLAYWIATPEQYLQPDQWQKLWRWML